MVKITSAHNLKFCSAALASPVACIPRFQVSEGEMESSPGLEVSTSILVKDHVSRNKVVKFFFLWLFVLFRVLFRTVTEPPTASSCSSFMVMVQGMVCWIFVKFFFIIPVAPIITTGSVLAIFSCRDLFTSFLRS